MTKKNIYTRYTWKNGGFGTEPVMGGNIDKDKNLVNYLDKVSYTNYRTIGGKSFSINEYINKMDKEIDELEKIIEIYNKELKENCSDISKELYVLIKMQGYKPTKAVKEVAYTRKMVEKGIWENHYKKIKKYL